MQSPKENSKQGVPLLSIQVFLPITPFPAGLGDGNIRSGTTFIPKPLQPRGAASPHPATCSSGFKQSQHSSSQSPATPHCASTACAATGSPWANRGQAIDQRTTMCLSARTGSNQLHYMHQELSTRNELVNSSKEKRDLHEQ